MSIATEIRSVDTKSVPLSRETRQSSSRRTPTKKQRLRPGWLLAGLALAVLLPAPAAPTIMRSLSQPEYALIYHNVARGDLPITVIERGNLESQFNVQIICEVSDIHGDGIDGTPIIWIVPNGTSVKEGDLLVELDSSSHLERLDSQILDTEHAVAAQIQADVRYENQKSQNVTAEAEAVLRVELTKLELKMFEDKERGSHHLEVEAINRLIEDINNEILAAQASLELKRNEKFGIESLFQLGYAGKSEVDRSRLEYLQAEGAYAAKMNRLKTQMATLSKKKHYEYKMEFLKLQGNLETAVRNLGQVRRNNQATLAQGRAAKDRADRALKKEQERKDRYEVELNKCKIYAPQDGMVAYAVPSSRYSRNSTIGPGALVRERQHILSLPNMSNMQVKTSVHESVQNQIVQGLKASIHLDAFPERSYVGTVESVAVLPDQGGWMNSDTKMYKTIVRIDDEVEELKPGMTAVVEIHVDVLQDIVSVPVQAIVQVQGTNWCYVNDAGRIERRIVQLGQTNDKFVEIHNGLDDADRVVLNPTSIVDQRGDDELAETDDERGNTDSPVGADDELTDAASIPAA